jgi:1-acyl-sn-glycerol-3-phosphate acyltransferase
MRASFAPWRRIFYWFITRVYFARITMLNRRNLPLKGPVLYLGLHRNGAVDGFVYHRALDGPTFMISTQLQKNWFARLFFTGIAVTRSKDEGARTDNDQALQECLAHLRDGGSLFVFPEGTSSLGCRHLPFKTGGLWLILEYMQNPVRRCKSSRLGFTTNARGPSAQKSKSCWGKPLI